MNPSARRIDQILTDAPLAATLFARLAAARQAAGVIAPICREIAPDFDPTRPGACELREQVLRIWLRSSAHSTKLRQAIPRMAARLNDHGLQVNEIKVGVQLGRLQAGGAGNVPKNTPAGTGGANRPPRERKEYLMPIAFAEKLALTLPESDLRQAVLGLGRALQSRLAGMRESDQPFDKQNREK